MRTAVFLFISLKLLFLAFVFGILQTQPAHADRGLNEKPRLSLAGFYCEKGLAPGIYQGERACVTCGGRNQPACEARRLGKQCTAAYTQKNDDDICAPVGGNGQPKMKGIGFDCRPGYNVDSNDICQPCGGTDQVACEATRPGDRCTAAYTQVVNGYCRARGGNGQPKLRGIGYDCRPGYNVDSNDICRPCGGTNQVACEATRPGDQCTDAYTQKNRDGYCEPRGGNGQRVMTGMGFECRPNFNWRKHIDGVKRCEPCGSQGQPRCEALRDGPPCGKDLEPDSRPGTNFCVAKKPSEVDLAYEASKDMLREAGDSIFNAIVPMAFEVHDDQDTLEGLSDEDEGAAGDLEDESRSFSDLVDFKTLSVGATAEANFIIGVGVESGFAFDITDANQAMKWYGSIGVSNQFGAGSSYGAVLGIWNVENDGLGKPLSEGGAKSVGIIFDLRTWLDFAGHSSSVLTDIGTQSSTATLLIGVWFDAEDVTEDTVWRDRFTGFTISPVLGVGQNIAGTTYVESKTIQAAAPSSQPSLNNMGSRILSGGGQLQYCGGQCWINGLGRERPDYLETLPIDDDPSLLAAPVARSRVEGPSTGSEQTDSADNGTGAVKSIALRDSLWMFEVRGNKFYLKIVDAQSNAIIVQRVNSTELTKYNLSSSGEYIADTGQRISVSTPSAGQWISADGQRTYSLSRVN